MSEQTDKLRDVLDDIRARMIAALNTWKDSDARRAILETAIEKANETLAAAPQTGKGPDVPEWRQILGRELAKTIAKCPYGHPERNLTCGPECAAPAKREGLRELRLKHWLTEVACDHGDQKDQSICACGWVSGWQHNVGEAVLAWYGHYDALASEIQPAIEPLPNDPRGKRQLTVADWWDVFNRYDSGGYVKLTYGTLIEFEDAIKREAATTSSARKRSQTVDDYGFTQGFESGIETAAQLLDAEVQVHKDDQMGLQAYCDELARKIRALAGGTGEQAPSESSIREKQ